MYEHGNEFDALLSGRGWGGLLSRDFDAGAGERGETGLSRLDLAAAFRARGLFDSDPGEASYAAPQPFQEPLSSAQDVGAIRTNAGTIGLNQVLTNTLESAGDHDWFAITLSAGQHITVLLNRLGASGLEDPLLTLRGPDGGVLLRNDDIDPGVMRDSRIEFTATTAGTYYIDAGAFDNAYAGNYQLQVFDSTSRSDVIAAGRWTTAEMNFGAKFNGVIDGSADHDWVAITLQAGQEYVVRINGDGSSKLSNPFVNLRAADGSIIASNDNTYGLNPEITFTASATGTYYVDVSGSSGSTGEYAISVTKALEVFTYDQIATQLTSTYWGDGQHRFVVGADKALSVNYAGLSADAKVLAKFAFQSWTDITGIAFTETTGAAEISFSMAEEGAFASSEYDAAGNILSSVVNIAEAWLTDYGTTLDSYSMQTFIHEIGHALGLGHAGDYNGSARYPLDADYANDSWATTVMSYFSQGENSYFKNLGFTTAYLTTPMNGDVVAMKDLYGLSTTTRLGNTTYGFNSTAGSQIFDANAMAETAYCIVDSGGIDTLDYSGFAQNQRIELRAETFMNIGSLKGNVIIGRGTVIENAKGGSGNDTINGNDIRNVLTGNAGADTMAGNGGNDLLSGDAGNDRLDGGNGGDMLRGGDGFDALYGSVGNDLLYGDAGNDVLNGGVGADKLFAGAGFDRLIGGAGDDRLDGGVGDDLLIGGTGKNTLTGGAGADTFQIDSAPGAANLATVTDFQHLIDTFLLDRSVFNALGATGPLANGAFRAGVAALDSDDRIIYNSATGEIFYDADGILAQSQVLIAKVAAGTTVTAADFDVFASVSAAAAKMAPSAQASEADAVAPLSDASGRVTIGSHFVYEDAFGLF